MQSPSPRSACLRSSLTSLVALHSCSMVDLCEHDCSRYDFRGTRENTENMSPLWNKQNGMESRTQGKDIQQHKSAREAKEDVKQSSKRNAMRNRRIIQTVVRLFSGRRNRLVFGLRQPCRVFELPQRLSVVTTPDLAMEPSATTVSDFPLE